MKRIVLFILTVIFIVSCGNNNEAFNSNKLKGKYSVDFSSIINEVTKSESNDDNLDKLSSNIIRFATSSVKMNVTFYENNKGLFEVDTGLLSIFMDKNDSEYLHEFDYKVKNDSVMFVKRENEKEFKKWAIIKKYSDNYDYLKLKMLDDDKKGLYYILKKIK